MTDENRRSPAETVSHDAIRDALSQAVSWIEECGSDHEGRQFVLTEARAALKGMQLIKSHRPEGQ